MARTSSDISDDLHDRLNQQLAQARSLRDEARALSTRQLLPGSTSLVLSQLPRQVTLAEAAARVVDAFNLLHGGHFNRVMKKGNEIILQTDDRDFPFAVSDPETVLQVMEETLLFTHGLLSLVAPQPAKEGLVGIAIRRKRGRPAVPFDKLTRLRMGSATYRLRYDSSWAHRLVDRPEREDLTFEAVVRSQIHILRTAAGHPVTFSDEVLIALRNGAVDQAEASDHLGLSPATLRRRLAAEGTSFREIKAALLMERADTLLATSLPLEDVAARLGFSDIRSFNRAYRQQCGVTPAAARRLT